MRSVIGYTLFAAFCVAYAAAAYSSFWLHQAEGDEEAGALIPRRWQIRSRYIFPGIFAGLLVVGIAGNYLGYGDAIKVCIAAGLTILAAIAVSVGLVCYRAGAPELLQRYRIRRVYRRQQPIYFWICFVFFNLCLSGFAWVVLLYDHYLFFSDR